MKKEQSINQNSLLAISALTILVGAMLSGPISTGIVLVTKPQPAWLNSEVFIDNFHWIQTIPFMLGFVLLFSSCIFVAISSRMVVEENHKIMANLALISTAVYAALISFNYIIQIAYIPMLVKTDQQIVGFLTMTNPSSVCWAIEMFGYLFQGIAFWLLFPVFNFSRHGNGIRWLLFTNLVLSIGGAVAACIDVAWAMKPFGFIMFILWNFVLAALMGLIAYDQRNSKKQMNS